MFLLDTNVVSELRKAKARKADPNVTAWAQALSADTLFVSVVTIQELEMGTLLVERRDAAQGALLRDWLDHHVLPAFADRILPIDLEIARCAARLHVPDPRPVRDAFIAATAIVHRLTVATRNVSDFTPTGAAVVNPWVAPGHHFNDDPV